MTCSSASKLLLRWAVILGPGLERSTCTRELSGVGCDEEGLTSRGLGALGKLVCTTAGVMKLLPKELLLVSTGGGGTGWEVRGVDWLGGACETPCGTGGGPLLCWCAG